MSGFLWHSFSSLEREKILNDTAKKSLLGVVICKNYLMLVFISVSISLPNRRISYSYLNYHLKWRSFPRKHTAIDSVSFCLVLQGKRNVGNSTIQVPTWHSNSIKIKKKIDFTFMKLYSG